MVQDALSELNLTLDQCARLTGRRRTRLINFLLRWEQNEAVLACLKVMLAESSERVGLLDAKAQSLMSLGRLDAALDVIQTRNQISASVRSRALQARILLERTETQAALALARYSVEARPDSIMAWESLGNIHLGAGDLDAAKEAFRQVAEIQPHSRTYLRSMLALHQAQGDYVTASGYAVRIQRNLAEGASLPAATLRKLRDYYQDSGELNRVLEINSELEQLYQRELAALSELIGEGGDLPDSWRANIRAVTSRPSTDLEPATPLPQPEVVPVSHQERQRIRMAVHDLFGFDQLLPGQAETMAAVLRRQDVLTILPTGGGKSLCYQVPALMDSNGTTLVISPLIALMKDQVDSLPPGARRRATTINSSLDGRELDHRMRDVASGRYRLVYAAPERLRQPPFVHALRRCKINRLVVDEAHCVSVWGHDFRPDYLTIDQARCALGNPPLLAMTATAPPRVRRDILQRLGKRIEVSDEKSEMIVVATEVHRANLHLAAIRVRNADEKLQRLLSLCQIEKGSGIIYAGTRARCEQIAALLASRGISVTHYHAGIPDRAAVQDAFMQGEIRVVVATIAFGMGVDKADIRFIIHLQLPNSLEAYYQEVGRAGRDGLPARCTLIYSIADRGTLTLRARKGALSTQFLRSVYTAIRKRLRETVLGSVAKDDLARDVQADETKVRVALSVLEQVGLIRRHQDTPRTAVVYLPGRWNPRTETNDGSDWTSFLAAARLKPGQALPLDLVTVAGLASLEATSIEEQLLTWADDGRLSYRPAGRNLLLELLPPGKDASARIESILDQYATIQAQRVDEITAYAATQRCRHGHISAYLSGQIMEGCNSCDNCRPDTSGAATAVELPGERAQLEAILRCAATAPWSWGQRSLVQILRASPRAPEKGRNSSQWGALGFRSQAAIAKLMDHLVCAGLLCPRKLDHGGVVLDITTAGRAAVAKPSTIPLPATDQPIFTRHAESQGLDQVFSPDDEPLFQTLRAWRMDTGLASGLPPFVVAHDSVLKRIAATRPRNEIELEQIKGIGPKKLAQYGAAILAIVKEAETPQTERMDN